MKTLTHLLLAAGFLGTVSLAAPTDLVAQLSGVTVWSQNCGNCHTIQPANRYTAAQWETIVMNMAIVARMTDDEAEVVLDFLKGGAKRVASAELQRRDPEVITQLASAVPVLPAPREIDPQEFFAQQCVACHGKKGEGNGPAAVALNPKPTDLTDPEYQESRTDEQIVQVIADGKDTMPGFGERFTTEEIRALVSYIRKLAEAASK